MKNSFLFCILFLFALSSFAVVPRKEATEMFRNIKCLTCSGQSIEDSNSEFSQNLRERIAQRLNEGAGKEEIYNEIQREYGSEIFFTSPKRERNLIIVFAFVVIAFVLFFVYRKNKA